jgi:hypothetical protein
MGLSFAIAAGPRQRSHSQVVIVTLRLAVYRQSVHLGVKPFESNDQRLLFSLTSDEKMGLSLMNIFSLSSSVHFAHIACYQKFFLLHYTEVLCQYRFYTADHTYLTYFMLQRTHYSAPNPLVIKSRHAPHRKHSSIAALLNVAGVI